jgi:hypothetical protein
MSVGTAGTVLSYNGVLFGPYTETTAYSVRPVPDPSGRTISHNAFNLSFETKVSSAQLNSLVPLWRQALTKNGGVFIYTGRPTGDLYVNTRGVRDVENGPFVREVSFKNHGTQGITLNWSIEFKIPDCPDAVFRGRPMEFSYTVATQIDEAGYTTRTINLRVKVPQNREVPGSRISQDSADLYLEQLTPQLARGFRRRWGGRNLNEDRSEMTWTVIDEELTGPAPPPGIVTETANVSYSSNNAAGAAWVASLSYACEVAKDGSLNTAIDAATNFIRHRQQQLIVASGRQVELGAGRNAGRENVGVVPMRYRIGEPEALGRRKFEFSIDYTVAAPLSAMLAQSGIWTVSPDRGNWQVWSTSLLGTAFNPRGTAGIVFTPGQDRIVDLCGFERAPPPANIRELRARALANAFDPVEQEASWAYYFNALHLDQDSGTITTRTLAAAPIGPSVDRKGGFNAVDLIGTGTSVLFNQFRGIIGGGIRPGGGFNNFIPPPAGRLENNPLEGANTSVRVARPQQFVIMSGEALRVGFPVPEPVLLEVFGLKLIPSNRVDRGEGFRQAPVWHNGIQPFYYAKWKLRYAVDGDLPDQQLPPLPNPMYPS